MNKKLLYGALSLLGILLMIASGCQEKKSIIKGQLPTIPSEEVTIYLRDYKTPEVALDSVTIKNGVDYSFEFDAPTDGKALWVIDRPALGEDRGKHITLIPEKGTILIDSVEEVATGTPLNDELSSYKKELNALMTSGKSDEEIMKGMVETAQNFMKKHADHPISILPFTLITNYASDVETKMEAVKTLNGRFDDYKDVKDNTEMVENLYSTRSGESFKDFNGVLYTSSTAKGYEASMSDFLGKGQYVIVDFFASWCPPCRAEIKETLKPLYKEYRNKGLAIIGVSVSDKLEDNLACIEKLGIEWPVLFDADNKGANLYGVTSIPMIMLVGPDGKIIARNIFGDEVRSAVKEAFK